MAVERGLLGALGHALALERIPGVQRVVLDVVVDRAAIPVGACPRGHGQRREIAAVGGREIRDVHFDLVDRLERRRVALAADVVVVRVHAVDVEAVAAAAAGDVVDAANHVVRAGRVCAGLVGAWLRADARRELDEAGEVASLAGHVVDDRLVDGNADRDLVGAHDGGFVDDLDGLGDAGNGEHEIDLGAGGAAERHRLGDGRGEATERGRDGVDARGQVREHEGAVGIAGADLDLVAGGLGERDGGAGEGTAGGVGEGAFNLAAQGELPGQVGGADDGEEEPAEQHGARAAGGGAPSA